MSRAVRWRQLLDLLTVEESIEVEAAARLLGVSAATVRRDLDALADQQLLVRTRGGAVRHRVSYELPLRYKHARQPDEKHRVGVAVASRLLTPGTIVGLNGGTTTTEVARALVAALAATDDESGRSVTVVTNALNIAHELAVRPQVKLVVTGGVVRPESYELIGPFVEPTLQRIALDVAVIGVDGISTADGATTHHEGEAAANELMVSRARMVIVATDGTKVGRRAFAQVCPTDAVDVLVTTADADADELAALRAAGVDVDVV